MGELGFNKFFGAALATFLFIFGLNEVSNHVFGEGGHHGEHHYESLNEWAADKFHGYRADISETSSGAKDEGPVFDLGLMLANADPAAGETVLKRQCATCHTWNEGGANGTGPNLHGVVGQDIASASGFTYSGALSGIEGAWTYEQMNAWLTNPGSFARGTSMAYAGLRSPRRDNDRVNVIAYLSSISAGAPAFPAPLATEASAEETASETVEGVVIAPGEIVENAEEAAGGLAQAATDGVDSATSAVTDTATETIIDAGEAAVETATDTGSNLLEQAVDTAEEIVEDATNGEH